MVFIKRRITFRTYIVYESMQAPTNHLFLILSKAICVAASQGTLTIRCFTNYPMVIIYSTTTPIVSSIIKVMLVRLHGTTNTRVGFSTSFVVVCCPTYLSFNCRNGIRIVGCSISSNSIIVQRTIRQLTYKPMEIFVTVILILIVYLKVMRVRLSLATYYT